MTVVSVKNLLRRGAIVLIVAYAVLPFYWMLVLATRPKKDILASPPSWLPTDITFDSLSRLWSAAPLAHWIGNSLLVALMTTVIAVSISGLAAYGLVRFNFRGRTVALVLILFTLTVPTVVALVPMYSLLDALGLLNTRIGLALSYTVWAIPFTTLILRGYFQNAYTVEIEEAAFLDGCSRGSVLWHVVLPLSLPGLIASGIFTVLLAWNEFAWASIIASGEDLRTASIGLASFVNQTGSNLDLGLWMAGAVYLTVPIAVFFFVVQRYIVVAYGGAAAR